MTTTRKDMALMVSESMEHEEYHTAQVVDALFKVMRDGFVAGYRIGIGGSGGSGGREIYNTCVLSSAHTNRFN